MGEALNRGDERQRQRAHGQEIERAVLVVVMEDAVGREQSREQQRDPQNARRDARKQIEVRPESERRDRHDDEKEPERHADRAALTPGERDVAA